MKKDLKKQIAGSFSRFSDSYDQYAKLQKLSAKYLMAYIEACKDELPEGSVLEVGCGSGMISEILAGFFASQRQLLYMDIAPGMLHKCKERLQDKGYLLDWNNFVEMDAETITEQDRYAFIVSGLTVQWFRNLPESLMRLVTSLVPGGKLVFSFLGDGSFPEWFAQCRKSQVDCTLNPLPGPDTVFAALQNNVSDIEHFQREIDLSYDSVKEFFFSLKKTGAGVNVFGRTLTAVELRRLITNWESSCQDKIHLTCKVNYFSISK